MDIDRPFGTRYRSGRCRGLPRTHQSVRFSAPPSCRRRDGTRTAEKAHAVQKAIRLLLCRMAACIAQHFPIADGGIPGEGRGRLKESARGGGSAWAQCAKAVQQSPFPGMWHDFSGFYDIMNVISYKRTIDAVTHRRTFKYFYCEVSDMKKAASIFCVRK